MAFQATIDNDSVAALDTVCFSGRVVIVDSDEGVEAACDELQRARVIGFDTETRPSFRAGVSYKVALLQLSTADTCYLIRLNLVRLSNRLLKILGSRQILKVGADVVGDIRALHQLRHFRADGFVDLQHEAIRWGIEEKSLRKLSAIVLGLRVSKAQRLSNWEARQLTEQQVDYAATDAWVCIRILEELQRVEPQTAGELTIISSQDDSSAAHKNSVEAEKRPNHRRWHLRGAKRADDNGRSKGATHPQTRRFIKGGVQNRGRNQDRDKQEIVKI